METANRILREMAEQRGYSLLEEQEDYIIYEKEDQPNLCIFTKVVPKLNADQLAFYTEKIDSMNISHCILYYNDQTSSAKNTKKVLKETGKNIEMFSCMDLQINITKHSLQPEFRKLESKEREEMREKFDLTKFPEMLQTDAISRFYNFQPKDIIEIRRKDGTISFRIVK